MLTTAPTGVVTPLKNDVSALEALEAELLLQPQVVAPLTHRFAPGIYLREVTMPAGSKIIGHEHTTEHFNIVLTGSARVLIDGEVFHIKAPCVFSSGVGVRKVLLIEEEMRWMTVHATDETDIEKLESELVKKSEVFEDFTRIQSELQKQIQ